MLLIIIINFIGYIYIRVSISSNSRMTFSHMPFSLNFNLNKSEESIYSYSYNYYGKMSYMHMHARIPPLVFHKLYNIEQWPNANRWVTADNTGNSYRHCLHVYFSSTCKLLDQWVLEVLNCPCQFTTNTASLATCVANDNQWSFSIYLCDIIYLQSELFIFRSVHLQACCGIHTKMAK